MTRDAYLDMCYQLNSEPVESEIPVELADLPIQAQEAWTIYDLLPDRFDSFSGSYYGKDLSNLINYYELFNVTDKILATQIVRIFDYYEAAEINTKIKANSKKSAKK